LRKCGGGKAETETEKNASEAASAHGADYGRSDSVTIMGV